MATARQSRLARTTQHGAVSMVAGFLTGLVFFLSVGAAVEDAVFSAFALAALVAVRRTVTR